MKKIIILIASLFMGYVAFSQTKVYTAQQYFNNTTHEDSVYGQAGKKPVSLHKDSVKLQGPAGASGSAGKVLTSMGNDGFATWQLPASPTTADSLAILGNLQVGGNFNVSGNVQLGVSEVEEVILGLGIGLPGGFVKTDTAGKLLIDTTLAACLCIDTVENGINNTNGNLRLGGTLDTSTTITYNPLYRYFTLGNFNPTTFTGRGIHIGYTPYGVFNVFSADRNILQGALTAQTGNLLSPSSNFGRLTIDSLQQDFTIRVKDTIESGSATLGNGPDSSIYTNGFNAIIYKSGFSPPTFYQDIQRYVCRYYPDAPRRNRSFIEFITSVDLHITTPHNGFFSNKDKVQFNIEQTRSEAEGGDTATASLALEITKQRGVVLYGANGVVKASIDTTGIITTKNINTSFSTEAFGTTVNQDTTISLYAYTSGADTAFFNLDANASLGTTVTIKDGAGTASALSPIRIDSQTGNVIDSAQVYEINTAWGFVTLKKVSATLWVVIGKS